MDTEKAENNSMQGNIEKQDNNLMSIESTNVEIAIDDNDRTWHGVEEEQVVENTSEKEDEEKEEGEGEGDGEEEGRDDYTFMFKDGENPFDFVDDNRDPSVQFYKKFEQHEYEALANKKRKALEQCLNGEGTSKKAREEDDFWAANMAEMDISGVSREEIEEVMNLGECKRSRKRHPKKRGRRKGSKKKIDEKVSRMVGDATLHYSTCCYDKAIAVLREVVRLEQNLPESYHILGLVHSALGDRKREMDFYMIAAHLSPNPSLWKILFDWSMEQQDVAQASYCISKAIRADPEDIDLRIQRAKLYADLQDYRKAAVAYEELYKLCPENIDALTKAANFYQMCGQLEHSVHILEDYLKNQPDGVNADVVDRLGSILMESKAYDRALQFIEQSEVLNSRKEQSLNLKVKAGICHVHLGNMEMAQVFFNDLKPEIATEHVDLATVVADTLMGLEHYNSALNYFLKLVANSKNENGLLYLKIARCHLSLGERLQAISFFYKALETLQDDVDARITLASLLLEEGKEDEAISLLSPPKDSDCDEAHSGKSNKWLTDVRIKLKLGNILQSRGMLHDFVDVVFPLVRESLHVATVRRRGKTKKRLSTRVLEERVRVLDGLEKDNVFRGFRPIAPQSDLLKANRAKKLLQKKAFEKEKKKAEALASGNDWLSDDSDDESLNVNTDPHPATYNLLKDEQHHQIIIELCNALASLQRYGEALEIVNLTLRLAHTYLSAEKEEKLRSLGAQMAYNTTDPKHGFACVKYIVQQHPQSVAAWNCYYRVISRMENRDTRHDKFVRGMQGKFIDCVPPILVSAHQLTLCSHHQDAARRYLEAYKLLPENPLVNLCVGTALINLALGFRLQNKHQCVVQGLAFLYNNLRICENSQESLYNIARAYHHVGLVTLAATYYEKVIAINVRDYPIPKLPNEKPDVVENHKPGYCDLRREAAYNLHLIYKKSGALDLARQVLKDYCSF